MDGDFRAPWGSIHHDTEQMAVGEACPWDLTPLASAGGSFWETKACWEGWKGCLRPGCWEADRDLVGFMATCSLSHSFLDKSTLRKGSPCLGVHFFEMPVSSEAKNSGGGVCVNP